MTEGERYIGGPTGGVPERIFASEFDGVVKGQSGAELACTVSKNLIAVMSRGHSFKFIATRGTANPEMILFNIKSKIGDPQYPVRHPDIYAGELAKRAVAYFDEQGPESTKLKGNWVGKSSDNYNSYMEYLNEVSKTRRIIERDRKDAAMNTWTGRLAHSLGFTKIETITGSLAVNVIFAKPKSNLEIVVK